MTQLSYPLPMPIDGQRRLTGRQAAERAQKLKCLTDTTHPTACQGHVQVGLFFDGTGNNREWVQPDQPAGKAPQKQEALKKHSNVARLFDAHRDVPERGVRRFYVQGVGTPFEELGDSGEVAGGVTNILGNAGGFMGADRINFGLLSIFNAMHRYLAGTEMFSRAETCRLANTLSIDFLKGAALGLPTEDAQRWTALTAIEQKLENIIRNHQRKLLSVTVSIYGFSRGAAQARACAHWLSQIAERRKDGTRGLAGVPLRVSFMGIFDTVAGVGLGDALPFTDGHMAWAKGTQSIASVVEKCVHFAALHEQRASFPVEAAANAGVNVAYPGMHSDVGGGYRPNEQGKGFGASGINMLSQVPLIDMHFEAIKAGVVMDTVDEMEGRTKTDFQISQTLVGAYNQWLHAHGVPAGNFETVTQAHVKQLIRWRTIMHEDGHTRINGKAFYARAQADGWLDDAKLWEADGTYGTHFKWLKERFLANETTLKYLTERAKDVGALASRVAQALPGGTLVPMIDWGLPAISAYEEKFVKIAMRTPDPAAATVKLFEDYVHDSRAGFKLPVVGHEPILLTGGYLRFRHVFESTDSESHVFGWANSAWQGLKDTGDATVDYLNHLWHGTVQTYQLARQKVHKAMVNAAVAVADATYGAAQRAVLNKYKHADQELMKFLINRYR